MKRQQRSKSLLFMAVFMFAGGDLAYAKRPDATATASKTMTAGDSVKSHNERQKTPHSQRKESALRLKAAFTATRNRALAQQGGQQTVKGAK